MQSIMHVIMAVNMSERHCIVTDHRNLHVAHALHSSNISEHSAANGGVQTHLALLGKASGLLAQLRAQGRHRAAPVQVSDGILDHGKN